MPLLSFFKPQNTNKQNTNKHTTIEEDATKFVEEEYEQNERLKTACLNAQSKKSKDICKEQGYEVTMGGKKRRMKKSRKSRKSRRKNHKKRATRRK